jgi:hypothetical protein
VTPLRQVAILAVMIASCGACGHAPTTPKPIEVHTVVVRRGCLHDEKRPAPTRDMAAVVGESVKPWGACYPLADAIALAAYLAAMERWIDNALIDCGSTPATSAGPPRNGAP